MLNPTPFERRDIFLLLVIVVLSAFMRFYQFGIVEYFHDDAMLTTMAQEMVTEGKVPLTGILSSTGIPNPPTSVYFMAIPFSISLDPVFAIGFIMAWNVLGCVILWVIGHRYFGRWVGFSVAIIYAVSPWAVYYSRKIWAQDFHTPFILLAILLALYGFTEDKPRKWAQLLALPVLLFGLQIHFAAWALAPLYLILLWIGRKNIHWKTFALSLVLSIFVMSPFLIGLSQTLQLDPNRVTAGLSREPENTTRNTFTTYPLSILLAYNTHAELTTFTQCQPAATSCPPINEFFLPQVIWVMVSLLSFVSLFGFCRSKKEPQTNQERLSYLLLIWIAMPFGLLLFNLFAIYPHYFIATLPAIALIQGLGFGALFHSSSKMLSRVGMLILISCSLWQVVYWHNFLEVVDTEVLSYPQFTTPLHDLLNIREELTPYQDVVVVSQGMAWDLDHEVGVWDTLLKGRVACVRTIKDGYFVQPAQPFALLVAPNGATQNIQQYNTQESLSLTTRANESYTLYSQSTPQTWQRTPMNTIEPTRFDNGVQLIGYQLQDGEIILQWLITRNATRGEDYQYSVQAFDTTGTRVGQIDTRFWQSMHWCAGDILTTYTLIQLSNTPTEFRVSMYQLGTQPNTFINANVLDVNNTPIGQQAIISLPTP
jgi:4-amino-4-deoxy-L-arabinose transferase-like glycosyltransferase